MGLILILDNQSGGLKRMYTRKMATSDWNKEASSSVSILADLVSLIFKLR